MIEKKLSLKEVARVLGISPSAVSLVLHDKPGVSAETRSKTLQLLKANGYLENGISKHKKDILLFKYTTIGYFPDKNDGFITAIIDSIGSEAQNLGCNILVNTCHEGELNKILDMVKTDSFSGIIILGTELLSDAFSNYFFQKRNLPIILVDSNTSLYSIDSVNIDNRWGIYTALNHLYDLGHRRIEYLHSCIETSNFEERSNAFISYSAKVNGELESPQIHLITPSLNGAYETVRTIIRNGNELPTAFLADNDTIAFGAMKALKENGFQIPGDISIIGFDDNAFCKMSEPPLTTIRIPADYMGKRAVRLLCERIEDSRFPKTKIRLNGDLILRESTAPPRLP